MDVLETLNQISRLCDGLLGRGLGSSSPLGVAMEVAVAEHLLGRRTNPLMLDVGGNAGEYTEALLARFPSAEVHVFEPQAALHASLVARFAGRSVHLHRFALSDAEGTADLHRDQVGSGLASLHQRDLRHVGATMADLEVVRVTRFDAWADEAFGSMSQRVDFAKIDVEGHEFAVLRGMGPWLDRVDVLQFEFGGTAIDARTFFRDYYYFLRDRGFEIFRLSPLGLIPVHRYSEREEVFEYQVFYARRTAGP